MRMGECASKKTKVMEDLSIQASNFTDSLVVDLPESIGEMIPAPTLVGESTAQRTMQEILAYLKDNDVQKIGVYGMGGSGKRLVFMAWEHLLLEEVGIPEPTSANGCKLVLTTRNLNVCVGMSCKSIKMELLSKEEARKLFLDKLGHDVFNTPNLKAIAEEVLEKCAQLPLAIVTIAASFKCLTDDFEWRDALEELRTSLKVV
uniref:NB-ARC domain-containing protein n=1 Tax=Fagus sylvatica TaxID=28930 RepID=A0A2N9HEK7_FAGSY